MNRADIDTVRTNGQKRTGFDSFKLGESPSKAKAVDPVAEERRKQLEFHKNRIAYKKDVDPFDE